MVDSPADSLPDGPTFSMAFNWCGYRVGKTSLKVRTSDDRPRVYLYAYLQVLFHFTIDTLIDLNLTCALKKKKNCDFLLIFGFIGFEKPSSFSVYQLTVTTLL